MVCLRCFTVAKAAPAPQTLLATNCTVVQPMNQVLVPSTTDCYTLTPDQSVYSAVFKLDLSSVTTVAFFGEHVPTEFELSAHYLIDKLGSSPAHRRNFPIF